MNYKPNEIVWRLALLPSLLLSYGCAQVHAVALDCPVRPELPSALAKPPPPEGTFLRCLQELSQGTSAPSCATLSSWLSE